MSNKDVIYDAINSFGSVGIKKSDLKKKFEDENLETILNELISEEKIVVTKKGTFIYCWGKEFYLDYLLGSDIKFKYLYNSIITIQNKINNYSDSIFQYIEKFDHELVDVKNSFNKIEAKINELQPVMSNSEKVEEMEKDVVSIDMFKDYFDNLLSGKSSSIGWVELSSIKNEICNSFEISDNEFYTFVSELTELYPEKYELSSGGYEGVILRGIVHGFVRCI